MSSRTRFDLSDQTPAQNESSQEDKSSQMDEPTTFRSGHRPTPWVHASEIEILSKTSQTEDQNESGANPLPLTRSKITETDAEATNFIVEKNLDESKLETKLEEKGEVMDQDEHENKDQNPEQKPNGDQDQRTDSNNEEASPSISVPNPDPQGKEPEENENKTGPEDPGFSHEHNKNNDHDEDPVIAHNFSLGLPPLRRKIFPCFPYGTIIPTCKPLIGKDKRTKGRQTKRCKSPGKWRGPLKDVMNSLLELERIEESAAEDGKKMEEAQRAERARKRAKVKKTVAQADAMLRFKMTEMQALFTGELKELHDTFEKLKKKPNPRKEAEVEDMWLKRRKQFQTEIDECMESVLEAVRSIS